MAITYGSRDSPAIAKLRALLAIAQPHNSHNPELALGITHCIRQPKTQKRNATFDPTV